MTEDLSASEVVNLLQRLVSERRVLEKGLEIGQALQGAQQKIQEYQKQIPIFEATVIKLTTQIKSLEQQIISMEKEAQSKHVAMLAEHKDAITVQQAILTKLRSDSNTQKKELEADSNKLKQEIRDNDTKYGERKQVLASQIKSLEQEFSSLRNKVLAATGV